MSSPHRTSISSASTSSTTTTGRLALAQDAQRRAEQELHSKNLRIVNLESDLSSAKDQLDSRDEEIARLRESLESSSTNANNNNNSQNQSLSVADRSKIREELINMQWLRELALLELQESVARNEMLDAARTDSYEVFSDAFLEIGKQQGDEAATERLRHRINTLLFQLRITQSVQIKKLREQIAEMSGKLTSQQQQQQQQQSESETATSTTKKNTKSSSFSTIAIGTDGDDEITKFLKNETEKEEEEQQQRQQIVEAEVKKQVQEQTASLRKELAQAEKARLDYAGRLSDTSREMREHRQNSLTALNEAQKWESEAKKLKNQLRDAQQEVRSLEKQRQQMEFEKEQQQQKATTTTKEQESDPTTAGSVGRDENNSPREYGEAMQHHRELSELQLLVDDLQSQVASSQMRLQESERKLRLERDRGNMASSRCSQLEDEMAVIQAGGGGGGENGSTSATEERINDLQNEVEQLTEKLTEQRITLNSEKQANDKAMKEKDNVIAQQEKQVTRLQQDLNEVTKERNRGPSREVLEQQVNDLKSKLNEAERALRGEKSARERETAVATSKIAELENTLTNRDAMKRAEEQEFEEVKLRNITLEDKTESLQKQLEKAEAQNHDLDRKLTVKQRQADELERDLAVKVEQFALLSQQNANSNNQKEQLSKAQVKLDGARHSITMLLLSQQYLAACIDLFTESVGAATEEARFEREMKLTRELQNKHRDQMQAQQIQHTAQVEELKSRFARQQRLENDMNFDRIASGSSSSPPGSPSYGANEQGTGLVFSSSGSASNNNTPSPCSKNNNQRSGGNLSSSSDLDMQIALERKSFAYLSSLDLVASHSNTVATFYLESCLLAINSDNERLQRKLREYQSDRNSTLSNLDSKIQILQTEKSGLQNQLNNTQGRFEERVAHLTAEVKEANRREKELREKADASESEQRKLQNKVHSLQQEIAQLEDYAEDLKTSRELERSVLHARIQAAEEANSSNKASLDAANATNSASVSDLASSLEAANLQIAREHAQVVELEGNVSELKSSMLKERRSRAALEATHREEIAVLEQRLGEVRAELAALQLQRGDPNNSGGLFGGLLGSEDGGLGVATSEFSRPQLQRELKITHEKLSVANAENNNHIERARELEKKLMNEKDHNASSRDQIERLDNELETLKKTHLDLKKELDQTRARHATELITREGEFDKSRKKMVEQLNEMQEEQNSLKLQLHSQQMDHMSELHKVERHCLDRIAAAEGEAASSNRQMFEELQDRKERVVILEKKLSSVTAQLDNRDQLLTAAREHIETLQAEQKRKSGTEEDDLAHYRQELRDLSNALVDAKRAHIAAADRSRQIMTNSEAELAELRNECTALRADIVELESKHRTDMIMKDTNHANEAKELKYAKELLDEYKEKVAKMEKEHGAESSELRKRIEGLLSQVATEDVMDQLKRAQKQAEIEKERAKEAQDFTENIRMENNKLEAECERLRVHTKQVELESEDLSKKLKVVEASVDKKVEQQVELMHRKIEVEAQLWEAKLGSVTAENSQLRRLLLEEKRTSSEAGQRIAQLEIALDDLEMEMIEKAVQHQVSGGSQQQQQQQIELLAASASSPNRRLPSAVKSHHHSPSSALNDSHFSPTKYNNYEYDLVVVNREGEDDNQHQQQGILHNNPASSSSTKLRIPFSNVRQRLLSELPSLAQVIEAKQTSRLELERLEYERRTEIEADVFEWRWALSAFSNLLQSVFHSFSIQIMRANDHAATIESDVTQLESDVRSSLILAQKRNSEYEIELQKLQICYDESQHRNAVMRHESYLWSDGTRMLVRELANHAKLLHISNKRLVSSSAALQQQQKDIFLFHRRQLQDFEKDNRQQISFAMGQSYGFFFRVFIFARTVILSYEKRNRNLQRRLELIVSTERDVNDVNLTILNRKYQHQQQLILQHQKARENLVLQQQQQQQQQSPFAPASSLLFGDKNFTNNNNSRRNNNDENNIYNTNSTSASFDVNLRALPEFKRADLAQTPLERIQRDELLQRRLLQDLFVDWVSTLMMNLSKRSTFRFGQKV